MERRPVGLPTELEAADAEASKKRREMETVHPQGEMLYAEFKGIRQRKGSLRRFLNR
jgi:hypothetical protein